ncbi:MAG TPA: methyltransferase domain-containing protein [Alphaproteobacteria bacterium]|nr:methyltransferase domain-containing protein [Alphaproteobacteria bacterium]
MALSLPPIVALPGGTPRNHLHYIHMARCRLVRTLLPPAATICDLGGANSPLHLMGYPYPFERMVMVDLPTEERHEIYGRFEARPYEGPGTVEVLYANMVHLDALPANAFDLVWSGQSIEHVDEEDGRQMCAEAFRILKPGGAFCLDTPNGLISSVHAATAGLKLIHPEHKIEYEPARLEKMLWDAGFAVIDRWGICRMPQTATIGVFSYDDFRDGGPISKDVENCYIQYYACRKPAFERII